MTEQIQMVDLRSQYLRIKQEVDAAMEEVLNSTAFINGPQVQQFAEALSRYLGGARVVPCANGTDALQIAMMALDLKPGAEMIVPVHTYVATAEVIALLGLTPVFVDVDPDTFTINIEQTAAAITARTAAIVPVNLYGQCAHLESLRVLARKHHLFLIEDNAQALGADYRMVDGSVVKAGTVGHVGTTSFFPSKNLGCFGDGGAVYTHDTALAAKMKVIANHGQQIKYQHDRVGINSRLDTLQAAILLVKLKYLDEYAARRARAAAFYDQHLKEVNEVQIPVRAPYSTHVFHQYTLRVKQRDELKNFLEKRGIPTMIYYPIPLHLQAAYRVRGFEQGAFPVAEQLSKTVLSLPIHTEMEEGVLARIVASIKEFYA